MVASFVLVHSPLIGPSSWRPVAEELQQRGHRMIVPSLVDAIASPPPRYAALASAVVSQLDEAIVLVVHSAAGALVPSIVDRTPYVEAVVFVDATLPHPGRTWFDTVPREMGDELRRLAGQDGLLPSWHQWFPEEAIRGLLPDADVRAAFLAEIPQVPLGFFEEVAPALDAWQERPCGYVQLSAAYAGAADNAQESGWPVLGHDGHHLSAVTEPAMVTNAIVELADRLR